MIGVLLLFVNAYINIKIYIYFMLDKIFYYVGEFGPLILLFFSLFLLWNKHNLFFYYCVGYFVNAILNLIIKGIIQQPRPSEDPKLFNLALKHGKRFIFKDYIPHDIFGMPSGHAQSCLFSTIFIFLSLHNIKILYMYLAIICITIAQRVAYDYHTIFQVFVGTIVGSIFGYYVYYLAEQKMKGKIREKPDDYAPI
jgi:membrane-associated phospholipid phosphatase